MLYANRTDNFCQAHEQANTVIKADLIEDSLPLRRWMVHITGPEISNMVTQYETECGTKAGTEQISYQEETELARTLFLVKVSKVAKIRNRYNQVPHLTKDTNGKVTNSQKTPQTRAKRSALSQQVTTKHI